MTIILILFFSQFASAESILLGHSLTPTSYTLPKGSGTIGNFAVAYGINDRLMVAISPWLISSYNMYNLSVRYRWDLSEKRSIGTQIAYFKTGEYYPDIYVMEAAAAWTTYTIDFEDSYKLHVSGNYMYFFDETIPFSLRQEPYNDQPYQFSLSTLQEFRFQKWFGAGIELGVLGINYTYPNFHLGVSLHYKTDSILIQLGLSQTIQVSSMGKLYSQEQVLRGTQARFIYHPEVHIQWFF